MYNVNKPFSWMKLLIILFLFTYILGRDTIAYAESINLFEYEIPTLNSYPNELTSDKEGNIWFTEEDRAKIGKLSKLGVFTEYQIEGPSRPHDIVAHPNGNIWFTDTSANAIGKISPEGIIEKFVLPNMLSHPYSIAIGPDDNIWFTEYNGSRIGKITSEGVITEYNLPSNSIPYGITSGADGNVWFSDINRFKISKITPSGNITEFSFTDLGSHATALTKGQDGNVWFIQLKNNTNLYKVGKITPEGILIEYQGISFYPYDISAGPNNKIWFTERLGGVIGSISQSGLVTEYPITYMDSRGITSDGFGNIWFVETTQNKIIKASINANPSSTPTPTPIQNLAKDFKQTDPRWGGDRLGNDNTCGTIYSYGCAVTSVANVFYSYGKRQFDFVITELNPGTFNDWLSGHQGYTSCSIIWGNASASMSIGAPTIIFRNGASDWMKGKLAIDHALADGSLPILGVYTSFGTHFFVVSEKLPDVNGKPDYKIIDPALYPFSANAIGNTGKSLSQTYGGFDNVFETVIYNRNSAPKRTLTVRGHSPIQLRITDPQGNITGYNNINQEVEENIPDSVYGSEDGIASTDGSSLPLEATKYFQQINPTEGEYKIEVIGTGDGTYTLDFSKTNPVGQVSLQEIHGIAKPGQIETYLVQHDFNVNIPIEVKINITFSQAIEHVRMLELQGLIMQKSTAHAIVRNLEQASAALDNGDSGKVDQNLDQISSILTRERGKKVSERAYQILSDDIMMLKKHY